MKTKLLLPVVRVLVAAVALTMVSCVGSGAYKQADSRRLHEVEPFYWDSYPFHHHHMHNHHNHCHPL